MATIVKMSLHDWVFTCRISKSESRTKKRFETLIRVELEGMPLVITISSLRMHTREALTSTSINFINYGECQPAKDVCRRVHAVIWNRKLMVIECKSTKHSSTKEFAQYSSSSKRRPRFTQSKFAIRNSNVPQLRAYEQPCS